MNKISTTLLIFAIFLVCNTNATTYTLKGLDTASTVPWSTAAAWEPAGVPGPGDEVVLEQVSGFSSYSSPLTLDLGGSDITIASLTTDDYAPNIISNGKLTVTTSTNVKDFYLKSCTLTTRGTATVQGSVSGYPIFTSSTWNMEGATSIDFIELFKLVSSTVNNKGVLTTRSLGFEYDTDATEGWKTSSFVNTATGVINWSSDDDSRTEIPFTNNGIFNLFTGEVWFDYSGGGLIGNQISATWAGTVNVYPGASLFMYGGVHTFVSGCIYNISDVTFHGSTDVYASGSVNFEIDNLVIAKLTTEYNINVNFKKPNTRIKKYTHNHGILSGNPIFVDEYNPGANPIDYYNPVIAIDVTATSSLGVVSGKTRMTGGAKLYITGTFKARSWEVDMDNDDLTTTGTIIVNPGANLTFIALDSPYERRSYISVPVENYGSIWSIPPESGYPCKDKGNIVEFLAGGIFAGPFYAVDCNAYTDRNYAEFLFAGEASFQDACTFGGPGAYSFLGANDDSDVIGGQSAVKTFAKSFSFKTPTIFFADPIITTTSGNPLYIDYLIWNGGILTGEAPIYLNNAGKTHVFTDDYNRVSVIEAITVINNGKVDNEFDAGIEIINGGLYINNGNTSCSRFGFGSDGTASVVNNGNMTMYSEYFGSTLNRGYLTSRIKISGGRGGGTGINYRSDLVMTSNSTFVFSFWGNANAYLSEGVPFDQVSLGQVGQCQYGGVLRANFIQPLRVTGQSYTPYVPTVGERYVIMNTPADPNDCKCQFSSVVSTGLPAGIVAALSYDNEDDTYAGLFTHLVLCASTDSTCINQKRTTGAYAQCGATGVTTTISGSGSTSTTGSESDSTTSATSASGSTSATSASGSTSATSASGSTSTTVAGSGSTSTTSGSGSTSTTVAGSGSTSATGSESTTTTSTPGSTSGSNPAPSTTTNTGSDISAAMPIAIFNLFVFIILLVVHLI